MKVNKILFFVAFLTSFSAAKAQILRGTIINADSGQPLSGVSVRLSNDAKTRSDSAGVYSFDALKPGYYRCEFSLENYNTLNISEIAIAAGKEQVLNISLTPSGRTLPDVSVTAALPGTRALHPLAEIPLTRDQVLRFPAMYFDPGRLTAAYPGVVQTDDGINGMSIRGNNPNNVRWLLEGLEIVNPNHLPNAGTFDDQPAGASGGILMFSAQLLDNSALMTGAFPAGYGNATGGVMDMYLRPGNNRRHEFTAQAGLIGLDLAAEGPLKKNSEASYLANYRYSTVGLLGQMGISFGDEQINFQDLSFKLHFPGKRGGSFSVFGMGGLSENIFLHKTDTTLIERYKDLNDIRFYSKTGVLGASGQFPLGAGQLRIATALSVQQNEHLTDNFFPGTDQKLFSNRNFHTDQRLTGTIAWQKNTTRNKPEAGLNWTLYHYERNRKINADLFNVDQTGTLNATLLQPWLRWLWKAPQGKLRVQTGLQAQYFTLNKEFSIDPRLNLIYNLSAEHSLSLGGGLYSQLNPLYLYTAVPELDPACVNCNLEMTRSAHAGLRHTWRTTSAWQYSGELFYQYIWKAPEYLNGPEYWSFINLSELSTWREVLMNNGKGRNYGLEVSASRQLPNSWYLNANATLFRSEYRHRDSIWLDSRWAARFITNFTIGREWIREKSGTLTRTFGINAREVSTGGLRIQDPLAAANYPQDPGQYREQLPAYFRIDMRVYWKRSIGNRRNSTFAIDLQNITAQQNVAYRFFDAYTNKVETKYQLGLIPNISWRLEF